MIDDEQPKKRNRWDSRKLWFSVGALALLTFWRHMGWIDTNAGGTAFTAIVFAYLTGNVGQAAVDAWKDRQ